MLTYFCFDDKYEYMVKEKTTKRNVGFTDTEKEYIDNALSILTVHAGDFIKKIRNEKKLSIRELSRRSGVSNAVISDIECYKSIPKIEVLLRLMYALEIGFDVFFKNIWYTTDYDKWAKSCGRELKKTDSKKKRYIIGDVPILIDDSIESSSHEVLTLSKILAHEGLTTIDIKDVLDFIGYKKYKRKNKTH